MTVTFKVHYYESSIIFYVGYYFKGSQYCSRFEIPKITLNHWSFCIYLGSIKNTRQCRSRQLGPFDPLLKTKSQKRN